MGEDDICSSQFMVSQSIREHNIFVLRVELFVFSFICTGEIIYVKQVVGFFFIRPNKSKKRLRK